MWVHWPKCLKISLLSKRYLISFVILYRLFVVFNNANAVCAELWVWGFRNHAWNKSLLSSHSSSTRDLTRILYHLWFPKPNTHISYSQHLHIVKVSQFQSEKKKIGLVQTFCARAKMDWHIVQVPNCLYKKRWFPFSGTKSFGAALSAIQSWSGPKSLDRHKTVMPCPSLWPKQFWLVQNDFGLTKLIWTSLTIMIWSQPKWNGYDQNELVRFKLWFST